MPINASECTKSPYLRLLVMAAPKAGKTTTTLMTCEKPAYVINCDDESSLIPAARKTKDFVYDNVMGPNALQAFEGALKEAREGVKAGRYKTVVWDTMTSHALRAEQIYLDSTDTGKGPDGRRAWPMYEKHLRAAVERLFTLKAHVVILAHYIDVGGSETDAQLAKSGPGIVPLLGGKARATIPSLVSDIVFLEKTKEGRVFRCSIDGVFGPGCRSLSGVDTLPADVMGFWKKTNEKEKVGKNG